MKVAPGNNLSIGRNAASQSLARQWNEVLLKAIRLDPARPTVNARTLFHLAVAIYDAWAAYDFVNNTPHATTFFLGHTIGTYTCRFVGIPNPSNTEPARHEAISYAAYRLLYSRYSNILQHNIFDSLFLSLGYDKSDTTSDYQQGKPAKLGNYLARNLIRFGQQDGSNEVIGYANNFYIPVNPPLLADTAGNPTLVNPNRWQPLQFKVGGCIDQNGHPCTTIQSFLGAEWVNVVPFALRDSVLKNYISGSDTYKVYNDPGPMPAIGGTAAGISNDYIWSFTLALVWSSHLDPTDGQMIDISPGRIGNIPKTSYPTTIAGLRNFYNMMSGGDIGAGYPVNPKTGLPYPQQIIPRGDYTRVLAEFWADGPKSETPPGHWFTILNYVTDHLTEKKWRGKGLPLNDLEWDVKSYLVLGGALHDAAVSAWSIKGYYDGVRPVSAIRYMSDQGQSSDISLPRYNPSGLPLIPGTIELVQPGDPLAGASNENVNKLKIHTWRGPKYINDPKVDAAGVGWILAERWYPYQRPSFVTPPFAGYISGHSTFSSAGAQVLSLITGDEYFPGGLGEFKSPQNHYLVFEKGPSVDVSLQWARYKDAADQSALSRIWGGIHPPFDDMPGRHIGTSVANAAVRLAEALFAGEVINGVSEESNSVITYPNPVQHGNDLLIANLPENVPVRVEIFNLLGRAEPDREMRTRNHDPLVVNTGSLQRGLYFLRVTSGNNCYQFKILVI